MGLTVTSGADGYVGEKAGSQRVSISAGPVRACWPRCCPGRAGKLWPALSRGQPHPPSAVGRPSGGRQRSGDLARDGRAWNQGQQERRARKREIESTLWRGRRGRRRLRGRLQGFGPLGQRWHGFRIREKLGGGAGGGGGPSCPCQSETLMSRPGEGAD